MSPRPKPAHAGLSVLLAIAACLTPLAGGTASAHETGPALTGLSSTERENQLALQQALSANAPSDAEHAAEHDEVGDAERSFDELAPARREAIRAGVAAAAAAPGVAADPAVVGQWTTAPFAAPTYAINMVVLPTGKVLVFSMGSSHGDCEDHCAPGNVGNAGFNVNNDGAAAVWDPAKGYGRAAFRILPPPNVDLTGYDLGTIQADPAVVRGNAANPALGQGAATMRPAPIFCTGQVQTADGRVLIAGGNLEARGNAYGLRMNFLFDPFTEQWTREPDLQHARWYPTLTRMPSGRIAILGGRDERGQDVASIELYPEQGTPVPGVDGAAGATGLPTSSLYDDTNDPANPLGTSYTADGAAYSNGLGYYPFSFVMPNGRLAISRWQSGHLGVLDPGTGVFSYLGGTSYKSALGKYATAFPEPGDQNGTGTVVMAGGLAINPDYSASKTLQDSVWQITPDDAAASGTDWQAQPSLNVARRNANVTLLPDGSAVMVAGGDANDRIPYAQIQDPSLHPARQVELWDPVTHTWTLGPAEQTPRGYHSTSVLLPDGRVLSGGDDWVSYVLDPDHTDAFDSTFEIYSPPYLFKGARPAITALPNRIEYGGSFVASGTTTAAHRITGATLVAPGSMTHAFDSNQRVLHLPVQALADGRFSITAPVSGAAAPPGDYMLFLLDERGVPSVGKFLRVASTHSPATGGTPPVMTPTPVPAATPAPLPTATPASPPPAQVAPVAPAMPAAPAAPAIVAPAPVAPAGSTVLSTPASPVATPAARLTGRTVRLALNVTPSGKSCPARVSVTVSASGRRTVARVKTRSTKSGKRRVCRIATSVRLSRTPSSKATVSVKVSGKGIRTRSVRATRR